MALSLSIPRAPIAPCSAGRSLEKLVSLKVIGQIKVPGGPAGIRTVEK